MALPKWMEEKPQRKKSIKAEKSLAKKIGGYTYINSGATLGQNDVTNAQFDFEHKLTAASSYSIKETEMEKLRERTPSTKTPIFVIEFSGSSKSFAVMRMEDFIDLFNNG